MNALAGNSFLCRVSTTAPVRSRALSSLRSTLCFNMSSRRKTRTLTEQTELYSSFLEKMKQDIKKKNPFEFASPTNIDLSPSESASSHQVYPHMPTLSSAFSPQGKESLVSDTIEMPAEEYFSKFKDFLVKNDLFVVHKDVVRPKTYEKHQKLIDTDIDIPPPSKRILFDSTFDSTTARDIAEPLEPGQIVDNDVYPHRCSDEIERECNVSVSKDVENVGPEANKRIVDMLQNFLARNRKAENIENLVNSLPRPSNMPFMQSPKLNKSLYLKISGQAQRFDGKCRKLQEFLNAASSALVSALQVLVENEMLKPEISKAGIQVKHALKLLTFANRDLNDRRKDAIRNTINPAYASLLNYDRVPSHEWLLGDDVDTDMDECDKIKKQGERLVKTYQQNQQSKQQSSNNLPNFRKRGRGASNESNRPREEYNYRSDRQTENSDRSRRPQETVRYNRRDNYSSSNQDLYRRQSTNYPPNRRRY